MGQVVGFVLVQAENDRDVGSDEFDFVVSGLGLYIPAAEHNVGFIGDFFSCKFDCFLYNLCV